MDRHHRRMVPTANSAVSWSTPTLTHQFLLLGIHGDHWLLPAQRPLHFTVEVFELGVAIRMAGAFSGLAIGLQTVSHLMEQIGDYLVADGVMLAVQLGGQVADALT